MIAIVNLRGHSGLKVSSEVSEEVTDKYGDLAEQTGMNLQVYVTDGNDATNSKTDMRSGSLQVYFNRLLLS